MSVDWPIAQTKWQNEHSAFVFDFLLVTRRKPAPVAPPVPLPARPVRPRARPEEFVSRRPPARPEGLPERLGGGKPSGPPEILD